MQPNHQNPIIKTKKPPLEGCNCKWPSDGFNKMQGTVIIPCLQRCKRPLSRIPAQRSSSIFCRSTAIKRRGPFPSSTGAAAAIFLPFVIHIVPFDLLQVQQRNLTAPCNTHFENSFTHTLWISASENHCHLCRASNTSVTLAPYNLTGPKNTPS